MLGSLNSDDDYPKTTQIRLAAVVHGPFINWSFHVVVSRGRLQIVQRFSTHVHNHCPACFAKILLALSSWFAKAPYGPKWQQKDIRFTDQSRKCQSWASIKWNGPWFCPFHYTLWLTTSTTTARGAYIRKRHVSPAFNFKLVCKQNENEQPFVKPPLKLTLGQNSAQFSSLTFFPPTKRTKIGLFFLCNAAFTLNKAIQAAFP